MFKKIDPKMNFPKMEEEVLKFWEENDVFQKSIEQRSADKPYVFYDGPPFATGLPHHGHLLASTSKDVIPRYFTMKGYQVLRRWGWDTHGLPIENIVEKKLGYEGKKEIEENIAKFNEEARKTVLQFADEWRKTIRRIGRWVDFDKSYKTMDPTFMESVWWGFKELHKKGLVYKDSRISLYCPHCATPLSNFEIAMDNSYQMDKDVSVYVKVKVQGTENTYFLVWTTTPWTLPANVALAVGDKIKYVEVRCDKEKYILAKDRIGEIISEEDYELISEFDGIDLVGKTYEPIFKYDIKDGYRVIAADFVNIEDGSGIVHLAPAFGEDDFLARKASNLPIIENIDEEGKFVEGEWRGMNVWDANFKIVGHLKDKGYLFKKENITHSYPHCYRCKTKLIYKAQPAWFIKVSDIKDKLIEANEKINWHPDHLKLGRFLNGLENAPDWNVSRSRYWGNPMPIWECEKCKDVKIVGSYDELEKLSGQRLEDYHRPQIDEITFQCEKCDQEMKRISDVFDCWVESGSMPFAEFHYPFENKETFEKRFPAQFISEYIAQTRGWFYTLHVMSTGLFEKPCFTNAVCTGTIAGGDGKKMSKSLGNFTDPNILLDKYGADAFRFYLMQSPLMEGENLNFLDKDLESLYNGMFRMLWNSYSFFILYANIDKFQQTTDNRQPTINNLLDRWIVSELQTLIKEVDANMEGYELTRAARLFPKFIDNLSNWYIRRSRKRFWKSENDTDKNQAYETLHYVLVTLSKLIAPFCPFIAEEIYRNLTSPQPSPYKGEGERKPSPLQGEGARRVDEVISVHLTDFPVADEKLIDEKLNKNMEDLREIISLGLQERANQKIKVRQPLAKVILGQKFSAVFDELIGKTEWSSILTEELNVKAAELGDKIELVGLDTLITPELKLEGVAREIIRHIQSMRKEAGYEVDNRIKIGYRGWSEVFEKNELKALIAKETLADEIKSDELKEADLGKTFKIEEKDVSITIKR
jgi:isoleucyl-tRNA synthetase